MNNITEYLVALLPTGVSVGSIIALASNLISKFKTNSKQVEEKVTEVKEESKNAIAAVADSVNVVNKLAQEIIYLKDQLKTAIDNNEEIKQKLNELSADVKNTAESVSIKVDKQMKTMSQTLNRKERDY